MHAASSDVILVTILKLPALKLLTLSLSSECWCRTTRTDSRSLDVLSAESDRSRLSSVEYWSLFSRVS